jgi:hypothetical protein
VRAAGRFQLRQVRQELCFLAMAQLVQAAFDPYLGRLPLQGLAPFPHVFTGVVEVQPLHRRGPAIGRPIPNPGGAVADH